MTPDRMRLLTGLLRVRRFDETLVDNAPAITGVFHVSIGMEATAAALGCLRTPDDVVMLNHRNHGHLVAIGSDPGQLYRELLGRDNALSRGRAGSVHLADPGRGVPYTSAMLAGGAAVGTGIALAKLRRREPGIVFAFFGDGAMGEGLIYEALNLAGAWHLPILFVCESNGLRGDDGRFARIAEAHGVPGTVVDGRRPRRTLEGVEAASSAVRNREGPRFVEATTTPWPGNSTFLPHPTAKLQLARVAKSSSDASAADDPVLEEARALLSEGVASGALAQLDDATTDEMVRAFAGAAQAPPPPPPVATESVWGTT